VRPTGDDLPRWTVHLEARARHITLAICGFLASGLLAEYLTSGHHPTLVGLACLTGAAGGYYHAGPTGPM
jgi:hypothetical protein